MNKHEIRQAGVGLRALLLGAVALIAMDASAQIGYVHGLSGSATFRKGTARPVAAKVGDTFEAGTAVATGDDGRVALKFADGQVVALGPASALNVQQYRFDAQNPRASGMTIVLETGTMRCIGGVIAAQNPQAVRISADESAVGIARAGGVDFTLSVSDTGEENGVAAVTAGEILVRTPYGPISNIGSGQAAPWRFGTPLAPPIPFAAAPAAIQALVAAVRSVPLPDNAPVSVDTAARATAALALAARAHAAAEASPGNVQLQAAARAAADLAGAAVQTDRAAAEAFMARILGAWVAALPATAAGPELAAAPALGSADPWVLPFAPIASTTTPVRCVGSPC